MDTTTEITTQTVQDFSAAQLRGLLEAFEHNIEVVRRELNRRSEESAPKTRVVRLGTSKKKRAKKVKIKKSSKKKKVEPTIKDMQHILESHDIKFTKSWNRDKHWSLIEKHRLIRETRKYAEIRKATSN